MKRMRHRKIEISEEQRTEIVVELKRTHPAHVYRVSCRSQRIVRTQMRTEGNDEFQGQQRG